MAVTSIRQSGRQPAATPPLTTSPPAEVAVRDIGIEDLRIALRQGWNDFLTKRGDLVFLWLVYPAVVMLAALYVLENSVVALVFPLFSGAVLLGPAAASGFYELARRHAQGLDARWRHFFDVFRPSHPSFPSLAALTTVTAVLFILWIGAASMIYAATLAHGEPVAMNDFLRTSMMYVGNLPARQPASFGAFLRDLFSTPQGWTMIVVGNLIGLVFAATTLAISVVSFPMLIDRPRIGWEVALRTSVRLTRRNPGTVALWGLIVVALLVLGSIPAFVGLAVVLPVLGYATWHLYTRAVER